VLGKVSSSLLVSASPVTSFGSLALSAALTSWESHRLRSAPAGMIETATRTAKARATETMWFQTCWRPIRCSSTIESTAWARSQSCVRHGAESGGAVVAVVSPVGSSASLSR
jgi:hypothetical protein